MPESQVLLLWTSLTTLLISLVNGGMALYREHARNDRETRNREWLEKDRQQQRLERIAEATIVSQKVEAKAEAVALHMEAAAVKIAATAETQARVVLNAIVDVTHKTEAARIEAAAGRQESNAVNLKLATIHDRLDTATSRAVLEEQHKPV